MRYIISGYLGLVGSNLKNRLDNLGHQCVYAIDLRNGTDIRNMNEDYSADVFFHLSAFCKINESIKNPSLPFQHNVVGTQKVLDYCVKNKIPKIVFTSSTRVLYPNKNPYTASKIFCEELIKGYTECYGIDYSIIRLSTVYHGFDDKTGRLIDTWMRSALQNKPLKIYGDENKTLDFSYTPDVVSALIMASWRTNEVFNVGTGKETKLIDVAQMIIDLAGRGSIEFHPAETAQPQNVVVDTDFACPTTIEEGLKKTFDFYARNIIPLRVG